MLKINLKDLYRNNNQKGGSGKSNDLDENKIQKNLTITYDNTYNYFCVRKKKVNNLESITDLINYNNKIFNSYSRLSKAEVVIITKNTDIDYIQIKSSNCNDNIIICNEYLLKTRYDDKLLQTKLKDNYKIIYEWIKEGDKSYIILKSKLYDNNLEKKNIEEEIMNGPKDILDAKGNKEKTVKCTSLEDENKIPINSFNNVLYSQAKLNSTVNWKFYKGIIEGDQIKYGKECLELTKKDLLDYKIYIKN
jgi:hypothetical protein